MLEQVLDKIGEPGVTVAAASPNSFAEEELVAAAKSGDEGAFETLFKRHQRRMLAFARRYTRVREDAEDVVQQTFQKAFIHLNKFQGKSSFSTWLTRIAINEALMLVRRGRALREIPVDDSSDHGVAASALETLDASPDPETSYLRRERVQILSETLGNLQPGLRLAIALRELAEFIDRGDCPSHGYLGRRCQSTAFPCEKETGQNNEVLHEITSDLRKRHPGRRR